MTDRKRKPRVRGNGMGCAYQRPGQRTWTVEVVVGWKHPNGDPSKPKRPVRKTKGGFPTKKAALDYASSLQKQSERRVRMTLEDVYLAWVKFYSPRVLPSTMLTYVHAYKHFAPLHGTYIDLITPADLQECMDNCPSGKRTHENMRCIANLLWKFAIDKNIVEKNMAQNLFTGRGVSVQRESLSIAEENAVRDVIGKERYAEYIYCLCWLGYRPGEFLELRKDQLFHTVIDDTDVWYFVNGKKTDAGRDRIVIVPDEIIHIVLDRMFIPGTDLIFPQYCFNKKKIQELIGFKEMHHRYFNLHVFKPLMIKLGIKGNKVPYSARHSYADKLKKASGSDKDKAALIGHSNYMFTQDKYQSSHIKDLYDLVKSFSSSD